MGHASFLHAVLHVIRESTDMYSLTPLDITVHQPMGVSSVRAGKQAGTPGHNAHLWPQGSWGSNVLSYFNVNASDYGGIFMAVTARLIPDEVQQPYALGDVQYLLSLGADLQAYGPDAVGWGRVGYSRSKWVTPVWQAFTFTDWTSEEQIRANPPPVEDITFSQVGAHSPLLAPLIQFWASPCVTFYLFYLSPRCAHGSSMHSIAQHA